MDELDDLYSVSLVVLMLMLSLNIIFCNETIQSYKTYFICRARASVSSIMCELGSKSKLYYRMSDESFWKLHALLKDEINRKPEQTSRRSRKKRLLH